MLPNLQPCNDFITSPMFVAVISGMMALAGALLNQLFHLLGEKKRHGRDVDLRLVDSSIRKQENIQALQLQALKELSTTYQHVLPNIWPSPDFDSDGAYGIVLSSMPSLMGHLNEYLINFGYIIPVAVAESISDALYKCNQSHWGVSTSESPAYEPSNREVELAKGALQSLANSITIFKECLGVTS